MSNRVYKKHQVAALPSMTGLTELPTDKPIAIYYRQSTEGQVGNISTTIQTVDMVEYLKLRGWAEHHIVMVDRDKGISGTTKIDERPGMKYLYELITEGKIGAVACQDEDRLFRDVTQIQVNIFVDACKRSNVLVLTPSMVYDFANEMTGLFHARQFRFKSEMAAEYINTVIKGRLHQARKRIILEGRWAGAFIPVGYMIDMRKTLTDGSKNENWRKYTIFEPYAEVVREYFRLFLAFSGNIRKTQQHIKQHGPHYPRPDEVSPPEGYKVNYKLKSYDGKYHPSRHGLKEMLINARLIGHWLYGDTIVIWNNHPPIIDEDTFMQAFNYRSAVTLDGRTNSMYRPARQHARPSKDEERSQPRPLCAGLIHTLENDEWRRVGTTWRKSRQHYVYAHVSHDDQSRWLWKRKAQGIDEAIAQLVRNKLGETFSASEWDRTIAVFEKNYVKNKKQQHQHLKRLEEVMGNLISSLGNLTNTQMILATQQKYEAIQEEHNRLTTSLAEDDSEAKRMRKLKELRDKCGPALENWERLNDEEKRAIINAFVFCVEATPTKGQGLHLKVRWRDNGFDELHLRRQSRTGLFWTPDEIERLHTLVASGAGQIEIASAFPDRIWKVIKGKYKRDMEGKASLKLRPKPIRDRETYGDYLARSQNDIVERVGSEDGPMTRYRRHVGSHRYRVRH